MPPGELPKPGKLVVTLPTIACQYALTCAGGAGVLVISFVTWAFGTRGSRAAPRTRRCGRAFRLLAKRSASLSLWHASAPGGGLLRVKTPRNFATYIKTAVKGAKVVALRW